MNQWNDDREYLERKFTDPEFYKDCPGIPMPELKKMLARHLEQNNHLPHNILKAQLVAISLENVQIRLSGKDYFPALASCMNRPLAGVIDWGRETVAKVLTTEEFSANFDRSSSKTAQVRNDFDHSVPDWDAVLKLGFPGLLERIEKYEKDKAPEFDAHPEYHLFYTSVRTAYQAALHLLDRLIAEAGKLPDAPKGKTIREALLNLRNGHAGTFYEALLQIWLFFQISEYIDLIQTRTFGNLDRVLYPYYRKDIDSGKYTVSDIRYFICSFMYQATAMHYKVGHPFYFGGTEPDNSSSINELSYLILDEYDKLGLFDPKLQIKVSENTPPEFIDKALDMIRRGNNSIAFVGEPCIIRTMLKHGYSLREAQTADIKGCYEYCAAGGTVETAPVTINAAKVLGLTLHDGVEILSGKKLGISTGDVAKFTSFRQLYRAFIRQLFYQFDCAARIAMKLEDHLEEMNPGLMISGTFESSLIQAQDGYARGAKYNNTNLWICAAATAADSLTAIKRYVFDRKEFTLPELVAILDRNFEGDELLRQRLLHDPEKYGNNQYLPDRIACHFTHAVARRFDGKPNARKGFFTVALHASNRFYEWANDVEATADGRKQGDEMNKNMSASQGCAIKGATSQVASVLKFDSSLFMADLPVDIMLHPSEIKGDNGLQAMHALVMTFIKNYGHAIHFNVMDADLLRKAQNEPEKYRHLQVRICGWNMLWNSISRREQDAYIRQAEKL